MVTGGGCEPNKRVGNEWEFTTVLHVFLSLFFSGSPRWRWTNEHQQFLQKLLMFHEHSGSGLHHIHVYTENHKLHKRKETKLKCIIIYILPRNVLFPSEHYVNFASAHNSQLLLVSQQCLIKNVTEMERWRRSKNERVKSAIIYDDGVVVMQKQWLRTINSHMQYILFTSHNVSL